MDIIVNKDSNDIPVQKQPISNHFIVLSYNAQKILILLPSNQ